MAGSVQEGLRILRISEICRINLFIVVHNHNSNLTHMQKQQIIYRNITKPSNDEYVFSISRMTTNNKIGQGIQEWTK